MIDGKFFRDAIVSASNNMANYRKNVDALNVFPVPDGDTGTNMSLTVSAAAREVSLFGDDSPVGEVAAAAASALLRGARGNSGVILSLIFRGVATGLKGCERADGTRIASALTLGVENAYKAVMKPTEGTILTVVRLAAQSGTQAAQNGENAEQVWEHVCSAAQEALEDTPNILPVLKKAGVVDAGGQGLVHIFNGMRSVFRGEGIISGAEPQDDSAPPVQNHAAQVNEEIRFGYCTEFLISRTRTAEEMPAVKLRAYLESIGDCVVVVEDDKIIKVHCHSNEPDNVLRAALEYGSLTSIKIDNMRQQHESASWGVAPAKKEDRADYPEPDKEFGIVAVAAGAGIEELFTSVGVDTLVSGGQTMNPSTEDILDAIERTPARQVFVLPNNKNIIMAAEQTVPLTEKTVRIIATKTIPQGVAAALAFNESESGEENHLTMTKASEGVSTAQITYAARDSEIESQTVRKGQVLGLENGKITVVEASAVQAAYKTAKNLIRKGGSIVTIYYGEGATQEQADELQGMLEAKFGRNIDVTSLNGGQPVYNFIISVEQ